MRRSGLSGWVWAIAAVPFLVLVATSTRYGYHRDEMYFIAAGAHPAFGYPDQPALVPLLSWAMNQLAPGSLVVLRLPSALVTAATAVLAALVAREVGGGRRAQVIAAGCTAASGFALAVGHIVSTTTFDLLSTTLLVWLMVRAIVRESGACVLAAGVVVGVGSEAKPQVGLVAAVVLGTLLVVGPRWPLRSWWTAAGRRHRRRTGLAVRDLAGGAWLAAADGGAQHCRVGRGGPGRVLAVPVGDGEPGAGAGLGGRPARAVSDAGVAPLRFVPLTYVLLAVLYIAGDGKAYYLASLYPALLGLGAVPTARWTLRARWRTGALAAAVVVSAAISAVIALPLLPETSLQGSVPMALNPDLGETVGWPRFIQTVSTAWRRIPAVQRRRTAIFTANYGEAGAIDLLGRSHGLPRAYSGHNGFSEWGMPPARDTFALVIGDDAAADAAPDFARCRRLASVNDGVGLDNDEQGLPLLLCRPTASWAALWPHLTHYD